MSQVIVVGGGMAGCAAAWTAARAGAEVVLLERTDMLAGLGLVTGMIGGASLTAVEEARAMGGGEIFDVFEATALHHIDYLPVLDRKQLTLFNVLKLEAALRKVLRAASVNICLRARAKAVKKKGDALKALLLDDGSTVEGAAFVDATGTAGTVAECRKYGHGCVMCILRCPTFGGRVSISAKAGVKDMLGYRQDGRPGAMGAAFTLAKDSLALDLVGKLEKVGYALVPLPRELVKYEKLKMIAAEQNLKAELMENLFIYHNGLAKVMLQSFMPLEELRQVLGLENARLVDPLGGGVGNNVRFLAMAPRNNALKVTGLTNLYCAGEKAGCLAGLPAVIVTGLLAGHNAARKALGREELELSSSTAIGDFIAFTGRAMAAGTGLNTRYGFVGGEYLGRMEKLGFWPAEPEEAKARVGKTGLSDIFADKVKNKRSSFTASTVS